MTELIIAEKPSAAKKIADALADKEPVKKNNKNVPYYELTRGKKKIIVACAAGHLFTLAERVKSKGFVYPVFDIVWTPTHTVDKSAAFTKEYVNTLKKVSKNADVFTVACDFDTEGSLIGMNIIRYISQQKDARRMKFSTLTPADLVDAYEQAQPHLDFGQACAGETRHYLDFYYGINISRALTSAMKSAGLFKILSTGRVQGPALKIVVDREREIQAFKPVPYWEIELDGTAKKQRIVALHQEGKFWDQQKAQDIFINIKDEHTALVQLVESRVFQQNPPTPFDLTTLQTECYRVFRLNPKDTLESAQSLYLMGVISYPRTSSQQYPPSIGYRKIVDQLKRQPAYAELVKLLGKDLKPNNGKKTDPAHPAIFPTGIVPSELGSREAKVYDIIAKRFLATFGSPAQRETVTITLDVRGETFVAQGTRTKEKGWHALYEPYVQLEEEELPPLTKGDRTTIKEIHLHAKETQPPKRYTPASLVKELERRSLGTKATRSEIVDTLYRRNYIVDESIRATELGIQTATVLEQNIPKIVDPELTKHFEDDMESVRENKKDMKEILDEARSVLIEILDEFRTKEKLIGEGLRKTFLETDGLGTCPRCRVGQLLIRKGVYGRFAACNKYPDCKTTFNLPSTGAIKSTKKNCDRCQHPLVKLIRKRTKPQEICLNPQCPTKQVDISVEAQTRPCPACKKGTVVLRKSFYGAFFGCDKYPMCKHTEKIPTTEQTPDHKL